MWQYNYTNPNELYHYGIMGMKWGVRRYQNEDGSLTSAGKSRYGSDSSDNATGSSFSSSGSSSTKNVSEMSDDEINKVINRKNTENRYKQVIESDTKNSHSTKATKDMSDSELNAAINRLNNEKRYRDLQNELNGTGKNAAQNNQTKQKVSLGKKLVDTAGTVAYDSVTQAATNVAKQWLTYEMGTAINKRYGKTIINTNSSNNKKKKKNGDS